ncbi:MAG: hypothetical protein KBC05_16365 [Candidatus Hydrogenedentes bacterium]|nr:hypothetical protein [Candidatus Hydrogenedentota bacterium]
MTTPRRIVLTLSPELYARLESRAAEGRLDAREWALRALLAALTRPESKAARDRRSREAGFALLSLLAGHPATERGNHAPNP